MKDSAGVQGEESMIRGSYPFREKDDCEGHYLMKVMSGVEVGIVCQFSSTDKGLKKYVLR